MPAVAPSLSTTDADATPPLASRGAGLARECGARTPLSLSGASTRGLAGGAGDAPAAAAEVSRSALRSIAPHAERALQRGESTNGGRFEDIEQELAREEQAMRRKATLRQRVWFTLDDPTFSMLARVHSVFMLCVICLSVLGFVASSDRDCRWVSAPRGADYARAAVELDSPQLRRVCSPLGYAEPWASTELACIIIFTADFVARFLVAGDRDAAGRVPSRGAFLRAPLNVVDLCSIAPFYIELLVRSASDMAASSESQLGRLAVIRILRLVRVLRVLKLSKSFKGVVVLMRTLARSLNAILMLLFVVGLGVVLFAALMFFAEQGTYHASCQCFLREDGSQSPFEDIFSSGWFALVTMTTVGYGERTVVTREGKAIAALCMVSGLLTISLPITIIGANFDEELKVMEIERRNHTLLRLQARYGGGACRPGSTLHLVRSVLAVQRTNVDLMLGQVQEQLSEQQEQLAAVLATLRTQLVKHGVSLEGALDDRAAQTRVVQASAWRGTIKREVAFGSFNGDAAAARALRAGKLSALHKAGGHAPSVDPTCAESSPSRVSARPCARDGATPAPAALLCSSRDGAMPAPPPEARLVRRVAADATAIDAADTGERV